MKQTILTVGFFLMMTVSLLAQKSEVFKTDEGAIKGYDPVAYFKDAKPVKGYKKFAYMWKDADWYFASQQNLDLFKSNPEKYAPQYGGYCAYGTAAGHKASTEPQTWTIVDNKLYLNYNNEVKSMWIKDKPGYIKKANENWPTIKDKE